MPLPKTTMIRVSPERRALVSRFRDFIDLYEDVEDEILDEVFHLLASKFASNKKSNLKSK